ncbi:MAG TPA: hypothetical protein VMG58_17395, partial [Candidatus Sulfotelmatobacter sp.]|nr:hypothetical protein [Candidatus Sulfotelmatobacter sp.]
MKMCLALVLTLALLTSGCYTVNYSASASARPISFTGEVTGQRTHFSDERHLWYLLWGLAPVSDTDIEKTLLEPRTATAAVQNVSITSEMTPLDVLINFFTGLVSLHRI